MRKTPVLDLYKLLQRTPNKKIEVGDLDKKDSIRSPDPSGRYLKSVSFRTGIAAEREP